MRNVKRRKILRLRLGENNILYPRSSRRKCFISGDYHDGIGIELGLGHLRDRVIAAVSKGRAIT
jgi:hypothetical protein